MSTLEEKSKAVGGVVMNGGAPILAEEMKIVKELQDQSRTKKSINSKLWHAVSWSACFLASSRHLLYYFPQEHRALIDYGLGIYGYGLGFDLRMVLKSVILCGFPYCGAVISPPEEIGGRAVMASSAFDLPCGYTEMVLNILFVGWIVGGLFDHLGEIRNIQQLKLRDILSASSEVIKGYKLWYRKSEG
ncbi:hypothetical protein IFM89_002427 [Coptis chinensis]|uniref:Uncharacterized protein n=1 Tax=Coptis chinensis TaxID=261450 RepID=A0A835ILL6_9MAGN|nr:hypothetical protein IFM89_002427 [Coptis chinensis]